MGTPTIVLIVEITIKVMVPNSKEHDYTIDNNMVGVVTVINCDVVDFIGIVVIKVDLVIQDKENANIGVAIINYPNV